VHVRVRLFAMQRELAATREVALELEPGATIESAWDVLVGLHPLLGPGRAAVRFARNGAYADATDVLEEGDELAFIPPVSGGAPDSEDTPGRDTRSGAGAARRIIELRATAFGPAILDDLADRLATPADGAVVAFLGRTRETPGTPAPGQEAEAERHAGARVEGLEYEAFDPMAIAILGTIADEIDTRWSVRRLAIVHRTGAVPPGEPSVLVVAAAAHRDAAFEAARYAIDETKARAPIWKAERFADGRVWIGEPARTSAPDAP